MSPPPSRIVTTLSLSPSAPTRRQQIRGMNFHHGGPSSMKGTRTQDEIRALLGHW